MNPSCPTDYTCTFTPVHPRIITHTIGPWWHGAGGLVVAILAVIALVCLLAFVAHLISEARAERRNHEDIERERQNKLAIQEQYTMQIDSAKGNAEILKMIENDRAYKR
jgi:uncharacterized membrane protein